MSGNVDKLKQAVLDEEQRSARRDMMDTLMTFGDEGQQALIEIAEKTEKNYIREEALERVREMN